MTAELKGSQAPGSMPSTDCSPVGAEREEGQRRFTAIDGLTARYQLDERTFEHTLDRSAADEAAIVRGITASLHGVVKPLSRVSSSAARPMLLDGPIVGAPRQDRNPHVQLDVDVPELGSRAVELLQCTSDARAMARARTRATGDDPSEARDRIRTIHRVPAVP